MIVEQWLPTVVGIYHFLSCFGATGNWTVEHKHSSTALMFAVALNQPLICYLQLLMNDNIANVFFSTDCFSESSIAAAVQQTQGNDWCTCLLAIHVEKCGGKTVVHLFVKFH